MFFLLLPFGFLLPFIQNAKTGRGRKGKKGREEGGLMENILHGNNEQVSCGKRSVLFRRGVWVGQATSHST